MEVSRRRALALWTGALAATAGCAGLFDDQSDESTDDDASDNGTADDGGSGDDDGGEDDENGSDDRRDPSEILQFADSVSPEIQDRSLLALDRGLDLIDGEPPNTIEIRVLDIDPSEIDINYSGTTEIIATATHREEPPVGFPGELAFYSNGQVTLYSQRARDIAVELLIDELPVEPPADAFESYPDEPLIAHEFVHAIQFNEVDPGGGTSTDGSNAATSVLEGTADYVAGRYRGRCSAGTFDPCADRDIWFSATQVPLWGLYQRMPYINGAVLAHRIREREGWEGLWAAHESPPETAWAAMFSEAYLDSGITVQNPPLGQLNAQEWGRQTRDTLGVNALYEKLAYLGQVWPTDEEAQLSGSITEETLLTELYRTELLRGWRGDTFEGYRHESTDEIAYRWAVQFDSETSAEAFADAIATGYSDRGSRNGDRWSLPGSAAAVDREGSRVHLTGAPTAEDLALFRA
jgi:hypothetical protein